VRKRGREKRRFAYFEGAGKKPTENNRTHSSVRALGVEGVGVEGVGVEWKE
jgi:hypothetical protein